MVKIFDIFIADPSNSKYGVRFAKQLKYQILQRFPNYGSDKKIRRVSNFLAPQFRGIHLEEICQLSQAIDDIKSYPVSNCLDKSFTENSPEEESISSDLSLSPTSLLRKKVRAKYQKTYSDKAKDSLRTPIEKDLDKYEQYSLAPSDVDILQWWKKHEEVLPILSQIAKQVLSIPASSAKSERVFSTGGNIVTKKRNRLNPKLVETLIIIKENAKNVNDFKNIQSYKIKTSDAKPLENIVIETSTTDEDVEPENILNEDDIESEDEVCDIPLEDISPESPTTDMIYHYIDDQMYEV